MRYMLPRTIWSECPEWRTPVYLLLTDTAKNFWCPLNAFCLHWTKSRVIFYALGDSESYVFRVKSPEFSECYWIIFYSVLMKQYVEKISEEKLGINLQCFTAMTCLILLLQRVETKSGKMKWISFVFNWFRNILSAPKAFL